MRPYADPQSSKWWRDRTTKIRFRWFGSTHRSETKDRITRWGKRLARKLARREMVEQIEAEGPGE
jgi:hypothetical protein